MGLCLTQPLWFVSIVFSSFPPPKAAFFYVFFSFGIVDLFKFPWEKSKALATAITYFLFSGNKRALISFTSLISAIPFFTFFPPFFFLLQSLYAIFLLLSRFFYLIFSLYKHFFLCYNSFKEGVILWKLMSVLDD